MTRARSLSRLANSTVFTVSDTNRVGIGSTIPDVKLDVGGKAIIDNDTQSTTTTSGALVVSGGAGIAKNLFVGGSMNVAGTLTYEDVTNSETAGITTTGGLIVTGLGATFGSISTHFSNIEFGAAGVGGTITPLGHAEFAGVVTATSFSGDGSGLTGVASTDNINTSTLAQFTGGVGIADSIFHIGDDNTAIRFPAADTFAVETAGEEALKVDSSGRVHIGASGGTVGALSVHAESNGNLHVRDISDVIGSLTGVALDVLNDASNSVADLALRGATTVFRNSSSETLRIDSSGRLLLGTGGLSTDQDAVFQVASTSFGVAQIFRTGSAGSALHLSSTTGTLSSPAALADGDHAGYLSYRAYDGAAWRTGANIGAAADGQTWASGDCPTRLVFATTSDGATSPTERLRITSTGRLLLGTATGSTVGNSQYSKLEVSGNTSTVNGPGHLTLKRGETTTSLSNGDTLGRLIFSSLDGGDFAYIQGATDAAPGSSDFPGRMMFFTTADGASSGTERARIDSSGRLRVGSQSGSDRTSHRLQVSSDGSDSLLSLQNFSNSDGSEMDIAFYALNTNNASIKFAQIVAKAEETQANSSQQGSLKFSVNIGASMTDVAKFNTNGHFVPASNDTFDLGGTSERWRNIYTGDLHLSNEGSANDVDGTWGDYTIQEGENDLFLLNRRNGKKFKFMLQEVS